MLCVFMLCYVCLCYVCVRFNDSKMTSSKSMSVLEKAANKVNEQNCGLFCFTSTETAQMSVAKFRRSIEEEVCLVLEFAELKTV